VVAAAPSADDPFIFVDSMWQKGVGGSIPSMIAYVFAVVGIFRLVRGALNTDLAPNRQRT